MSELVPVPRQPHLLLTPHTLALFGEAEDRLGAPLYFNDQQAPNGVYLACWRSYDTQDYLYEGFINHEPGFKTASNPKTGQRSHMRAAAGDLVRTDAAARAACREVGLIPDAVEDWHWNDPDWASMPIIASFTTTAGDGSNPLDNTTQKGETMSDYTVFQMTDDQGNRLEDWSRIGDAVLPIGTFPGGYEATADEKVARLWINDSGQTSTGPIPLTRTPYIAQQQWGAGQYKLRRADDIARIKEALAK